MEKVVFEIARGDSVEELLAAGVIEPATFHGGGNKWGGYRVIGGTKVPAEFDYEAGTVSFDGRTMQINSYGFGHPGRDKIQTQSSGGAFVRREVFFG